MVKRKTKESREGPGWLRWGGYVALALAGGCSPIDPADQAFFDEWEIQRREQAALMRTASTAVSEAEVIEQVQAQPAPEGEGTVADWIARQTVPGKTQLLFPRWSTARRGSNKQEVTFTFVLADARNNLKRMSYVWDVDVLDMTVGAHRAEELGVVHSPDQTLVQQSHRRIREHEKQLE